MFNTNNKRQAAYLKLINELILSFQNDEDLVLAAHSDLVDEGLVMKFLSTAIISREQDDIEHVFTGMWLLNFARKLVDKLGFSISVDVVISRKEYYIFFRKLLTIFSSSGGDWETTNQFLHKHNFYLDEVFLPFFSEFIGQFFSVSENNDDRIELVSSFRVLGNIFQNYPRCNRVINIEIAILCYEQILLFCTPSDSTSVWTEVEMNRAIAYWERIRGDKQNNLEEAITGHERALIVYTQEDFPFKWAMSEMNLALAYNDRIRGDQKLNSERAILGYQRALLVCNHSNHPIEYALIEMNLANSYVSKKEGSRELNLEKAIEGYERALLVYTQKDFSFDWARVQVNRASSYMEKVKGDRELNLEEAIEGYERALLVYTQKDFPFQWALVEMSLASAYSDRIKGDKKLNLKIFHFNGH